MIRDNRASKYLLYAIGEIILVVIGILIALQINNWNEIRKERKSEAKLLQSLKEDFQTTKYNLVDALKQYPDHIEKIKSQMLYLGIPEDELEDSAKTNLVNTGFPKTEIIQGSLNVLLSSNNLQLISNDSLKKLLTAYPSQISSFKSTEAETIHLLFNEHRPILEKHISLGEYFNQAYFPELSVKLNPSDFASLVIDRDFQNVLVKELIYINYTIREAEILLSKTDDILDKINNDLKYLIDD